MDIANELKNFAEEHKKEMSVNVYNGIWNIIQSIEKEAQSLGEYPPQMSASCIDEVSEGLDFIKFIKLNHLKLYKKLMLEFDETLRGN